MQENIYFISIMTENALSVLQRIASIFSRYRINIEQMSVFETANKGVSHFNIVLHTNDEKMQQIIKKLEKIIEVVNIKISNSMPIS